MAKHKLVAHGVAHARPRRRLDLAIHRPVALGHRGAFEQLMHFKPGTVGCSLTTTTGQSSRRRCRASVGSSYRRRLALAYRPVVRLIEAKARHSLCVEWIEMRIGMFL